MWSTRAVLYVSDNGNKVTLVSHNFHTERVALRFVLDRIGETAPQDVVCSEGSSYKEYPHRRTFETLLSMKERGEF